MSRMAAGMMDQSIILRQPTYSKTPQGYSKTEYTDLDPVWAHVEYADLVSDGLVDDVQVRDAIHTRVTIRHNPDVATEWRVRYREEEWVVISVQHMGINDDTMLRCRTGIVV